MQRLLSFLCARNIGALRHQPSPQAGNIPGIDDIRSCRRDPDIAGGVDDGIAPQLLAARVIVQGLTGVLERDQGCDVEPRGIRQRPTGIAGADQYRALVREKARAACLPTAPNPCITRAPARRA